LPVSGNERRGTLVASLRLQGTNAHTQNNNNRTKVTRYNPFFLSLWSFLVSVSTCFSALSNLLISSCSLIFLLGVLHEHPRIGSDGESEEVSLASDPDVTSPVKMRQKNRRLSEVINSKIKAVDCDDHFN
jgi:hypothetical protein